ncbi:MAG: DNA ligase D [Vulcanimicrobiota bacterium]
MSLDQYRQKRDFEATSEPTPGEPTVSGVRRFCLQRHRARRLHYDLRLEFEGVLKSWALPKGPTLTPLEKRLAVPTEDHPLEYLEWEGVIPPGQYGAGTMLVFDRGHYELLGEGDMAAQLERGDLKLCLHGRKVRGEFALVRTSSDQWLMIKKKDAMADPAWEPEEHVWSVVSGCTEAEIEAGRRRPGPHLTTCPDKARPADLPTSLSPMLARNANPFDSPDWLFEMKWDGFRALCFGQDGRLRVMTRRGNSLTRQFPELERLKTQVAAESFLLDGELVALDDEGVPDFQKLLPRMHSEHRATVAQLARTRPAVLYLFDVLHLDGFDLTGMPLVERRRLLLEVVRPDGVIRISDTIEEHGRAFFELVRERGLEGIVAKRKASSYTCGRSDDWLKIKVSQTLDCLVCGFTAPKGGRIRFGSLVLGRFREGKLVHVGNAGSGFSQALLQEVSESLSELVIDTCPLEPVPKLDDPVTWVRPELVCEVKYAGWSDSGVIRFPVFLRLRPDLRADDCRPRQAPLPVAIRKSGVVYREVDGYRLKLTNLEKVLFPADGITKGDLVDYYDRVAGLILPHLKDRVLSLKRYPDGIEGDFFFQKRPRNEFPEWIETAELEKSDGTEVEGILCNNRATLLYLANLACIDQNPTLSRVGTLEQPDVILFDLDPSDCSFAEMIEAAQILEGILTSLGLKSFPKTSGSRGIHIYVPVGPGYSFDQTRLFVQVVIQVAAGLRRDLFTLPRVPGKRAPGKVYIDYPQNRKGGTTAGPYVVRAVAGAPVSTPLAWSELKADLDFHAFNLRTAPARFEKVGDLLAPVLTLKQRLEEPIARLEAMLVSG